MLRLVRLFGVHLPAVLIGATVLLVFGDVIARNLFHAPISWAHDLAVILMSATVWFGLAGVCMSDQMFGIAVVTERLPPAVQRATLVLANLLTIAIGGAVVHAAYAQITTARFTTFLSLGWPKWIIAAILGVGMIMVMLVRGIDVIAQFRTEKNNP
jgi:C4-dicarboxylate transporter DctQ subunit